MASSTKPARFYQCLPPPASSWTPHARGTLSTRLMPSALGSLHVENLPTSSCTSCNAQIKSHLLREPCLLPWSHPDHPHPPSLDFISAPCLSGHQTCLMVSFPWPDVVSSWVWVLGSISLCHRSWPVLCPKAALHCAWFTFALWNTTVQRPYNMQANSRADERGLTQPYNFHPGQERVLPAPLKLLHLVSPSPAGTPPSP